METGGLIEEKPRHQYWCSYCSPKETCNRLHMLTFTVNMCKRPGRSRL